MKREAEESLSTWSKYAKTYDPIKCASIDGTDCEPHDRAVVRALNSDYKPNRFVKGRPESTIFISRLNHETSKETIKELFSKYGKLRRFRMVKDIVTGMPKGYAFVEYEEEHAAEEAYRLANKMVVDGNAIFVDFECERLLKGWKPRRLGGGFAGRKESGQLRFGGRDRPFKKPIALELKEQEERRQKERRCRDDERRRRDDSRDRNRTKSPQRQNGNSHPRDKSKADLAPKDKPKRSYSSREETNEGTPPKQKSNEKPSLPKNSHLSKSGSQETSRAKKPEPTTHCSPRSSPTRSKATTEKNIKLSSSRKQHDESKVPSKSPSHTSRENSLPRRNRSREPRRSPIKDFGRPRSPLERSHKRTPPRRSRRTSRSPKGRPIRKRSPLINSGKEPAATKDRLRSRSPLRKHDSGVSPLRSNRRNRRNRESPERQANHCSEQDRDRLASEENRFEQLSPRRINGRASRAVRSPPRVSHQGFDEKRTMPRDPSPSKRHARDDYPTERFADQTHRRFPENDMMGRFSESRLRRITSPTQEYSRRSPQEEQGSAPTHVHYQEYRPYEGASHYKVHPSYSVGMKNGTEFPETHTGFAERPTNRADFHHLPPFHGNTRVYAAFQDNNPQFSSVGSFRDVGPSTSVYMQEQKIEQQPDKSFYASRYDQPSRDPRQNTAQYAAHFPPQRQAIEQCGYVPNGEQHTIRRIEQVGNAANSYNLAANTSVQVPRELSAHTKVDERFWRQRTRP